MEIRVLGVSLILLVLLGSSAAGAVKIMGSFAEDPRVAPFLVAPGNRVVPFDATRLNAESPDVVLVASERDISAGALRAFLVQGKAAVVSNGVSPLWLNSFGIQEDLGALVQYRDQDRWRVDLQGPVSGESFNVRVYQDTDPAGSLHRLSLTEGSWDYEQEFLHGPVVIGGIRVDNGYLLVVPQAAFGKTDAYYSHPELSGTQTFFREAITFAASRVAKATPTPEVSSAVSTPASTPAPPPASGRLLGGMVAVILVAVVLLAVLRRRRRPPSPYPAGAMGAGYEPPASMMQAGESPPGPPPGSRDPLE